METKNTNLYINYYNSGLMILLRNLPKYFENNIKQTRTLIVPQPFLSQPYQQYFHITSKNYDFLLKTNPNCQQIYTIQSDTPSSLLKKNAIHIFPEQTNHQAAQQKYKAHVKRLEEQYQKSYKNCKTPAELFHLSRRIKTDIRQRCSLIGRITGKYKHLNLFKSINQINKQKTLQQYKKNGVSVPLLGKLKIFPQGPVWLPTTDAYLRLLQTHLIKISKSTNDILDIGCGSGVLSFILAKNFKSAKIVALDNNKSAIQTTEVNAASFQLKNILPILCDVTDLDNLEFKFKQKKCPVKYDLIISNPPWLIAKKNKYESQILDGVYDQKGKFLQSSFKIAKKYLKNHNSRFILIYSDLGANLGLQTKTIEELCQTNSLLVHSKIQTDYPKAIENQSHLSKYKLMSKVQLYEIGLS